MEKERKQMKANEKKHGNKTFSTILEFPSLYKSVYNPKWIHPFRKLRG